ncbi:hypothetical protein ACSBR1_016349 [Camellia fascicularis]
MFHPESARIASKLQAMRLYNNVPSRKRYELCPFLLNPPVAPQPPPPPPPTGLSDSSISGGGNSTSVRHSIVIFISPAMFDLANAAFPSLVLPYWVQSFLKVSGLSIPWATASHTNDNPIII